MLRETKALIVLAKCIRVIRSLVSEVFDHPRVSDVGPDFGNLLKIQKSNLGRKLVAILILLISHDTCKLLKQGFKK